MTDWQNRIVNHGVKPASDFLANPDNPRKHPQNQRDAMRGSLDTLGWIAPVIELANGFLLDGHERIYQALDQGDDTPVPFIVVDLTEAEAKLALASFDFLTTMATYDRDALDALLKDVQTDDTRLQAMLSEMAAANDLYFGDEPTAADDPGADVDRAAELQAKWNVQRGDVWKISKHRLMCGDSTSAEDVARLMGGVKADLGLTDPPYGVERDQGFEGFEGFGGFGTPIARRQYADDWDSERPAKATFDLFLQNVKQSIIFGGNFFADILPQSTHWVVWDKLNTMPTFGDCELAWTSLPRKSVKKFTFEYNGLIGKEKERFHPTQKPAGLFVLLLQEYSEAAHTILDPFCGSGTTLVACEQTGRRGFGMEISPEYCSVILERLSQMNLSPELEA
jgi:DNA modification methylase